MEPVSKHPQPVPGATAFGERMQILFFFYAFPQRFNYASQRNS
jgi:hypothetical protein